jgi:hypothetical protein
MREPSLQASDKRCLLKRALEMFDGRNVPGPSRYSLGAGDAVLFTRPDLLFAAPGAQLAIDLVKLASTSGALAWPFPCEPQAWRQWQCAADTLVAAPARALPAFRQRCVGKVSCWPEARGAGVSFLGGATAEPAAPSSFEVGNWVRRPKRRRLLELPATVAAQSAAGVRAARARGDEETRGSGGVEVEAGRAHGASSETPPHPRLHTAPQPFDALSRDGTEDFRKPHGAVWKSGHGCYRCAIKVNKH